MTKEKKNVPNVRFEGFEEEWEQRKVSTIAKKTYGGGTPKTIVAKYWDGDIPWIQSSDLSQDELSNVKPKKYITKEAVNNSATKLIPAYSIAIVTRVGVGKLAFMPYQYTTSQDFLSLSELTLDHNFGIYVLYKKLQNELNNVQGTSIKGITKNELMEKTINSPINKNEQKEIGNFFKQLDNLITLHQRKIDLLKSLKQGYLRYLFANVDKGIPTLHFNNQTNKWQQEKLSYFLETSTLKNIDNVFSKKDVLSVSGDFGIVNQIDFQGRSFAGVSVTQYGIVNTHDIVYTKSPLKSSPYGIIKVNRGKDGIVSTLYAVYTPKNNTNPEFVEYYFSNKYRLNKYLKPLVNKGAKNDMKVSDDNALVGKIIFPLKQEQEKISTFFKQLDKLITFHQQKTDKITQLKQAYLQNMFI